jgi:hypothetical protein
MDYNGVNRREYAAIAIMAHLAATESGTFESNAKAAVAAADALMKELAK